MENAKTAVKVSPQATSFKMVVVDTVEVDGRELRRGDVFSVESPDRARWLEDRKAAYPATSQKGAEILAEAEKLKAKDGGT